MSNKYSAVNKIYISPHTGLAMSVTVGQLVKRRLIYVEPNTTIRDAVKVMADENIGLVVVLKNNSELFGVLSERDVIRAIAKGMSLDEPVSKVCTTRVITITAKATLYDAADTMYRFGIRHLVVVDDENRPIGVVSIRDVVGEAVRLRLLAEQASQQHQAEHIAPHTD